MRLPAAKRTWIELLVFWVLNTFRTLALLGVALACAKAGPIALLTVFVPAAIPAGTPNDLLPDTRTAAMTFTGFQVTAGELISLTATGTASGGSGFPLLTADGIPSSPVTGQPFPTIVGSPANLYSLVATIFNSSNNPVSPDSQWFAVGTGKNITAAQSGELVFMFDDAIYRSAWTPAYLDNSGGFTVNIVDSANAPEPKTILSSALGALGVIFCTLRTRARRRLRTSRSHVR